MLADNGKKVKLRRNLFMTFDELEQLLIFLKDRYNPKFRLMVLLQFSLGLRASEMLSINMNDFNDDCTMINYRQAKTNKLIFREPIPKTVAEELRMYIALNKHTFVDGFIFPKHNGKRVNGLPVYSTETYGAFWSKWRRGCANMFKNVDWLEQYPDKRYRVSSHSLRRLHRTYLGSVLNNDFLASKLCHYNDIRTFGIYRNEFELLDKKDKILLPIMNPLMERLTQHI